MAATVTAARSRRQRVTFHLDKLVDAGLLRARYQAPDGPTARVGRRPKVYEPSGLELDVSIPERALTVVVEALEQLGYEPDRRDQRTVLLRTCPFRILARRSPEVVCAVNRSLLEGMLRGLGDQRVEAVLAPWPDTCCVELRAPRPRRPRAQRLPAGRGRGRIAR
jgi:predicted ArsR family transcriptional regulator